MRRYPLFSSILVAVLLALSSGIAVFAQSPVASPVAPAAMVHGIDPAAMDVSVAPGKDFYAYANGGWLAHAVIPPDLPAYGVTDELIDLTDQQQLDQLDALIAANSLEPGSDQRKAVELYRQAIDMDARNAAGISPVQPQLDAIAAVTTLDELHALIASPAGAALPEFFNIYPDIDPSDSTVKTGWLNGPYLGLGEVTYYTEDSESNQAVREAYKSAAVQFFQRLGMTAADAMATAQRVYDFEATLAADMLTDVEAQDFAVMYNPVTLDELQAQYPAIDWQAYMTNRGATVDGSSVVIDVQQRLMQNLAGILETTDLQTIKDYLRFQIMLFAAPYLDQASKDIHFGLMQALYGMEAQQPVNEAGLSDVNALMPDAMGQLYVAEYFSAEDKAAVEQLVANLIAAFRERLQNNTWMSDETRAAAIEKLDAMKVKVGYPDTWKTYESYTIGDTYWATVNDSLAADYTHDMGEYGQPVEKGEWWMGAQEVNAGYDPLNNDIMFPAAILQPPFYEPDADLASNYGAIGATIGHEITHGFDLSGSQFDKDGNYVDWWTDADLAAFSTLNDEAAAQYSAVEALPGLFVDGQLTVTENVADMGGLQIAWDALQIALAQEGDPGSIDGLTQSKRFFLAWAQSWRSLMRDELVAFLVQSNPHAPDFVRGVVPALNMDAFYDAFPEVQPGDPEYIAPEDRLVIW